jgi:hypothetical protein
MTTPGIGLFDFHKLEQDMGQAWRPLFSGVLRREGKKDPED